MQQDNSFSSSSTTSSGKRTREVIDSGGYMLQLVKKKQKINWLVGFSIKTLIDKIYVSNTTCML